MDKSALKNLFRNLLTFLIIFLLVQSVFNLIFPPQTSKNSSEVNLITASKEIPLHDLVILKLENHGSSDLSFKSNCPSAPVITEKLNNGQWQQIEAQAKINCLEIAEIINVKAGQTHQIQLENWNHSLFGEQGSYRFKLPLENGTILESNQFQITGQTFFGWIWLTLFFQPILNALIFLTSISPGHDLGIAIILLTILIRTLLLIPNQKALHSQKKLQKIQPKINELKEKHGNNHEKIAAETMAIYKEHKVNPMGSCLPILVQLPILLALFAVVQTGLNPNNNFLLYGSLKDFDLSQVQTLFLGILPLTKIEFLYLPIIVGLLQWLQLKISFKGAKTDKKDPVSSMNKSMTLIMPVMIAMFTASVPAGVGLYWAFSTIYGIIQQIIVNRAHDNNQTQIKVNGESKNKLKKKEYQEKTQKKHQQQIIDQSSDDSESSPPITIIKA